MNAQDLNSGERPTAENTTSIHQRGENLARYLFAARYIQGKTVLDAGCGAGYGSVYLKSFGPRHLVGVDVSAEAVAFARKEHGAPGLEFAAMSLSELGYADGTFDVVVMIEVVEHITNASECMAEIRRVLKPGGVLVLSTPNQTEHPGQLFNPFHVHEYTRDELQGLLAPVFRHVAIFGYGWTLGMFAWPMDGPGEHPIHVEPCLLKEAAAVEPPFFVAVCSQQEAGPAQAAPWIFPYTNNRRDWVAAPGSGPKPFDQGEVDRHLREAVRACVDHGKLEQAAPMLEALCQAQPDCGEWRYLLAYSLQGLKRDLPKAVSLYGEALRLGFDEFWVRYNRAAVFQSLDQGGAALADAERAVFLSPTHDGALEMLAALRAGAGGALTAASAPVTVEEPAGEHEITRVLRASGVFAGNPVVVADIGARGGVDARWGAYGEDCRVIAFEPDAAECERLNREAQADPRLRYYPVALHRGRGEQTLHITQGQCSSSFRKPNMPFVERFPQVAMGRVVGQAQVPTVDLDSFAKESGLGGVDFIKVDVEGVELDVLEGARQLMHDSVLGIYSEVFFQPYWVDSPLFAEVDQYLRRQGFALFDLHTERWQRRTMAQADVPSTWYGRGQLMFANGIYFKDLVPEMLAPGFVPTARARLRVCKLATLAELWGFPDYALELIETGRKVGLLADLGGGDSGAPPLEAAPPAAVPEAGPAAREAVECQAEESSVEVFGARIAWDIPVQTVMADFVRPGDCVMDIGANAGVLSVALSRMTGPTGQVHAFEEDPRLREWLQRLLQANQARNVRVAPAAGRPETVDEYCLSRGLRPRLLKVQPAEDAAAVLNGARQVLASAAPVVVLEYRAGASGGLDALEYLERLGYAAYDVNLYRPVTAGFYLGGFAKPPLAAVVALPLALRGRYDAVRVVPVGAASVAPGQRSCAVDLSGAGRFLIHVEMAGPDAAVVGLRLWSSRMEPLAYAEGPLAALREHANSCQVLQVSSALGVLCELTALEADVKELALTRVRVAKVEFGGASSGIGARV